MVLGMVFNREGSDELDVNTHTHSETHTHTHNMHTYLFYTRTCFI